MCLHWNYHRMLMLKLSNLYHTLLKKVKLPDYRMTREDRTVAGKVHTTIYGKISLLLTLTPMWSNGHFGGHLQLVDSCRHVCFTYL